MALVYVRDRLVYPTQDAVQLTVRYTGRFTCAGTSSPTVKSTGPWTVARTAAGTLAVTFATSFVEVLGLSLDWWDVTGSTVVVLPLSATVTPGALNTPASFTVETQSTLGTKADLTGVVVSFDVAFRKGVSTK